MPEACGGAAVEETGGDDDTEAEAAGGSGLVRSLRQRLEEERARTEEAEAELDRQRAGNAGLGSQLSRLEAQLASKKAFWEVGIPASCISERSAVLCRLSGTGKAPTMQTQGHAVSNEIWNAHKAYWMALQYVSMSMPRWAAPSADL